MLGFYNYTVITTYIGLASAVLGMGFAVKGRPLAAVFCLMISGILDGIDGRIARTKSRTPHEKRFGIQIDSLCDLICFGVLPCVIGYSVGMNKFWSVFIMIFYILSAIIRLAYFNVMEEERQEQSTSLRKYYEGLPVTSIALIMPFIFCLKPFFGTYFPMFVEISLVLVAIAFISRFKVRKPDNMAMILMVLTGIMEVTILIMAVKHHVL